MLKRLSENLRALRPGEGLNKTAAAYLDIYRAFGGELPLPQSDALYLFYVADGSVKDDMKNLRS